MIAIAIWFFRGGRGSKNASGQERPADLLDYLLPRDIYTHVSARVDITLYVFERLLRPLWATALILSVGTFAETQVIAGFNVVMGLSLIHISEPTRP